LSTACEKTTQQVVPRIAVARRAHFTPTDSITILINGLGENNATGRAENCNSEKCALHTAGFHHDQSRSRVKL
jgi:hypothetical protein